MPILELTTRVKRFVFIETFKLVVNISGVVKAFDA